MEASPSHTPDTSPRSSGFFQYFYDLLPRFSPAERLALYVFSGLLILSVFFLLVRLNDSFLVSVPERGGALVEGIVGTPRFVNPLLAVSQADKDVTALVYSGLMRATPDGDLVPDLAESYTLSEDGLTYTFKLRTAARFHDGEPVTSADVLYTVKAAQNSTLKSTRQTDWVGVTVTAPDAQTVIFTLPRAYAPFMQDTTMGILPAHLWQTIVDSEFSFDKLNTHPIGSGPYRVTHVATDGTGAVTEYTLAPFTDFTLDRANVGTITLKFFSNRHDLATAFTAGDVDAAAGVSPADMATLAVRTNASIHTTILPRVFGVFINQSHNAALADLAARRALDAAVDKQALVNDVLYGFGAPLDGPVPPGMIGPVASANMAPLTREAVTHASSTSDAAYAENARTILEKGGWKWDEATGVWKKGSLTLSFTLATADEPELIATAERVVADWRAAGIDATVHTYPLSDFNATILRPRTYDAILFGEALARGADLFAFWDASQRNDPGLNFSLYANVQAGTLLSKARAESDDDKRAALYAEFAELLKKDAPAVFLYSPAFTYILPSSLHGVRLGTLASPAERFLNVYEWYTQTERVWSLFADR